MERTKKRELKEETREKVKEVCERERERERERKEIWLAVVEVLEVLKGTLTITTAIRLMVEVGVAAVVAIQEVAIGGITTTRTRVAEVEEEEIEAEGGDVAGRGDLLTATATWAALGLNLQATPQTARAGR